ncbi:phage protein [Peribacillus muralis]|uniref:Uncharacterized protein n=1 Tax=Peribacillus muralis TaxID=264697 RepID=A0A1B3XMN3_9BACI|nr:hypothetical protein [Peribacillus muralis]AOH54492.1 hypothetical protein ABE28_009015 [Peribacillus muralis]
MMKMTLYNFKRVMKVSIGRATFTNEDLHIRFEIIFDDDMKPNKNKVQLFNLSKSTISTFKQGDTLTVQAGYSNDVGVLSEGKVYSIKTSFDGVDKITTIYSSEGDDYTKKKIDSKTADKGKKDSITFKKNSKGSTMIRRMLDLLDIKLGAPMKLKNDKVYKKGYTISKLIYNDLEDIVRDCGSIIYHRRGKLVIRPLKEGTDERFVLEEASGLIGSPSVFTENNKTGYSVKCLMQHRITTCSIIELKSKTANGKYRAFKGKHVADKNDFYTEFSCE